MSTRKAMVDIAPGEYVSQKSAAAVRAEHRIGDVYVSPSYGDGGSYETPRCDLFTDEWEPIRDRMLLQLLPEEKNSRFVLGVLNVATWTMERSEERLALVLKIGPGRKLKGRFVVTTIQPGQIVVIGRHDDWRSSEGGYVIAQEADTRAVVEGETMSMIQDRVCVQRIASDEMTRGGIVIPDVGKEKPNTGRVVSIGPDVFEVKKGDYVLFGKYAGSDLSVNGEQYIVMREESLLARVDPAKVKNGRAKLPSAKKAPN